MRGIDMNIYNYNIFISITPPAAEPVTPPTREEFILHEFDRICAERGLDHTETFGVRNGHGCWSDPGSAEVAMSEAHSRADSYFSRGRHR